MLSPFPSRPSRPAQAAAILWNHLLHRSKPLLASYKISYRCNLRCQPCPFYPLESPEPTYDQACQVINQLYRRGNRILIFEGGEPLLWRDGAWRIHDLVNYARQFFFSVGLTTNGTQPLDVPTDVLWVSIDGLRETHNALRGAPIFDQMLEQVRASRHPRLFAHVTVNALNAAEIPELLGWLNSLVRGITLQFYYPYNHRDELWLDFEQRAQLLEGVIALKRGGIRILNSIPALRALQHNRWRCLDHLMDNANPDGSLQQGCYLKGRADIDCSRCGFSPHTEISLACQGNLRAMLAGMRIFM